MVAAAGSALLLVFMLDILVSIFNGAAAGLRTREIERERERDKITSSVPMQINGQRLFKLLGGRRPSPATYNGNGSRHSSGTVRLPSTRITKKRERRHVNVTSLIGVLTRPALSRKSLSANQIDGSSVAIGQSSQLGRGNKTASDWSL